MKIYTKSEIKEQLKAMNAPKDSVVMVHASLRLVGEVEGGGEALLDALIEYFTEEGGLLCIPTHTWGNLGTDKITLDLTKGESNLGAFAVIAANDKRGVRSENPTHSVVVFGDRKKAETLIRGEGEVIMPTTADGVYGKLYTMGGKVLLMGVCQNKNTYLHAVAEILDIKNRRGYTPVPVSTKKENGEVIKRDILLFDEDGCGDVSLRFPKYETAFRYHGAITDGFIGRAPTQLCDAVIMKETVELIFKNSGGIDPLKDEKPIPPKWYA